MSLRICDVGGKGLFACASFEYRGYLVSASTVFAPNTSVVVFPIGKDKRDPVSPELGNVEAAIEWIDANPLKVEE